MLDMLGSVLPNTWLNFPGRFWKWHCPVLKKKKIASAILKHNFMDNIKICIDITKILTVKKQSFLAQYQSPNSGTSCECWSKGSSGWKFYWLPGENSFVETDSSLPQIQHKDHVASLSRICPIYCLEKLITFSRFI